MALTPDPPTPKKLLDEAKAEPHQRHYDLLEFGKVIDTLFRKGFSYAKIARWLSTRLGAPVERGQVFYIYKKWLLSRAIAQNRRILTEDEASKLDPLSSEPEPDPDLDKFLQESEERRMNTEADREDTKWKGKRRKKA